MNEYKPQTSKLPIPSRPMKTGDGGVSQVTRQPIAPGAKMGCCTDSDGEIGRTGVENADKVRSKPQNP